METTTETPDLTLKPGERGRYVIRGRRRGRTEITSFVTYEVWDRQQGTLVQSYASGAGANNLAWWLNAGETLERALARARDTDAMAHMN